MEFTGATIHVDDMGRIVVPKKIRQRVRCDNGTKIDVYTDEDSIILKRHDNYCKFCGTNTDIIEFKGKKYICRSCAKELKNNL